jgi:heme exporter protein A
MKIVLENIAKYFGEKKIFSNINFEISSGSSVSITGPNGSGKTTLMRIVSGLINPTEGKVTYYKNDSELGNRDKFNHLGLVGPYLELYDDLTALENLRFFSKMKRITNQENIIFDLLDKMNLAGQESELVKNFSSGMKQRLKYVFALLDSPEILLLDEPTSNLDKEGINTVYNIMEQQKSNGILVIATNDEADLKFGDEQIAITT